VGDCDGYCRFRISAIFSKENGLSSGATMKIGRGLACCVVAATLPTWAQDRSETLEGTSRVHFQALESRGALIGCSVVFSGAVTDTTYERGDVVAITGSVAVYVVGEGSTKRLAPSFKFGVHKLTAAGLVPTKVPDFVYAKTSGGSLSRSILASEESDTKGMRRVALDFDAATVGLLRDVGQAKTVSFAYSRGTGGLDMVVPVDFAVVDSTFVGEKIVRQRDPREGQAFDRCVSQLIGKK